MSKHFDQQLKETWEHAALEDLNIHFDTEKIWNSISENQTKKRVLLMPIVKYAAAVLLGILLTLGYNTFITPNTTQPTITASPTVEHLSTEAPSVQLKPYTPITSVAAQANTTSKSISQVIKANKTQMSLPAPMPTPDYEQEALENTAVDHTPIVKQPVVATNTPKVIHILDIEQVQTKRNKPFIDFLQDNSIHKGEDIAFSTKIITKAF